MNLEISNSNFWFAKLENDHFEYFIFNLIRVRRTVRTQELKQVWIFDMDGYDSIFDSAFICSSEDFE